MQKVAVGSTNPVKIGAAKRALEAAFDIPCQMIGVSVPSGVSDQPMSDEETILGAKNRAEAALRATDADLGLGLEGGIAKANEEYFTNAWVVIVDRKGRVGIGATPKLPVPHRTIALIRQGLELGKANDLTFGTENNKQAGGHGAFYTNGLITREDEFYYGVLAALSRFLHPELFD